MSAAPYYPTEGFGRGCTHWYRDHAGTVSNAATAGVNGLVERQVCSDRFCHRAEAAYVKQRTGQRGRFYPLDDKSASPEEMVRDAQ